MDKITFPYQIKLIQKAEKLLPESIVVRWKSRQIFEQVLVIYKKKVKKTLFGTKIYYEAFETEYIPHFVGVKQHTLGYRDYVYNIEKFMPDIEFFDEKYFELVEIGNKKIRYEMEPIQTKLITLFNCVPIKFYDHWISNGR